MEINEAFKAIDAYNAKDPTIETYKGENFAKELIYGQRMSKCLNNYAPDASMAVQLAARCQHIGRWEIPRQTYPMERTGYLKWRKELGKHHAAISGKILGELNFGPETIERVQHLLQKKNLKKDAETQLLEDTIFLVFVQYYLEPFANKHEDDKVIDIIKKTLNKVSSKAIEASTNIEISERMIGLINKAST